MCSDTAPPFIPYGRHSLEEDDIEAVVETLRAPFITQGPRIEAFERALCEETGAKHAVALSSGTAALHAAYTAIGLEPGDEIVTSPNTFVATANAAVFLGARPVFADIEDERHNIDPGEIESHLGPRTRALVAVDFAGHPAEMDRLRELADRHGLRLVEDASHSLGATYRNRRVGALADVTCLSFHPVKSITSGEGGALLTDDADLARACRRLRTHGLVREAAELEEHHGPWYQEMQTLGWNYRITDIQCALGISQLAKLGRFVERRRELARRYEERIGEVPGLALPREAPEARSAWHLYVVRVPAASRRSVFERLRAAGIGVQVHYVPVYRHPFYRRLNGPGPDAYPRTEDYYARAISLPLFPTLTEPEQDRVVAALTEALKRSS